MTSINAIVYREADGRYTAEVPACPGCATWGNTRDEAIANLHEAAALYFDEDDATLIAVTGSSDFERISV